MSLRPLSVDPKNAQVPSHLLHYRNEKLPSLQAQNFSNRFLNGNLWSRTKSPMKADEKAPVHKEIDQTEISNLLMVEKNYIKDLVDNQGKIKEKSSIFKYLLNYKQMLKQERSKSNERYRSEEKNFIEKLEKLGKILKLGNHNRKTLDFSSRLRFSLSPRPLNKFINS